MYFILGCAGSLLLLILFSSCGEQGLLFVQMCRLLIVVAFLVAEQELQDTWVSEVAAPRL